MFRYATGKPGFNRVTVYERYEGGPLWVEHWPRGKRVREPLSNLAPNGRKVYDKKLAMRMADALAAMIAESEGKAQARAVFGMAPRRTLKDLLDEYHGKRSRKWSESNRHHQESMRRFWLNK